MQPSRHIVSVRYSGFPGPRASQVQDDIGTRVEPLPRYCEGHLELHLKLQELEANIDTVREYYEGASTVELQSKRYLGSEWRGGLVEAAKQSLPTIRAISRRTAMWGPVAPDTSGVEVGVARDCRGARSDNHAPSWAPRDWIWTDPLMLPWFCIDWYDIGAVLLRHW